MATAETDNVKALKLLLALGKNSYENKVITEQTREFFADLNPEQQQGIDEILIDLNAGVINEAEAELRSETILESGQYDRLKRLLGCWNRLVEKSHELRRQAQTFQKRRCQAYNQPPIGTLN
jgi:hypothetical protein